MEMTTVIILRAVERLAAILIGGLIAYLGYRLFREVPVKSNSAGEFKLPGGTAIHLTRIGPGIFFSLFGTAIVLLSFSNAVHFQEAVPNQAKGTNAAPLHQEPPLAASPAIVSSYSGAVPVGERAATGAIADLRVARQRDIAFLNRIPENLSTSPVNALRDQYLSAIPRIKLALMEPLWDQDWGSLSDFRDLVDRGEENFPAELSKPGEFFKSK